MFFFSCESNADAHGAPLQSVASDTQPIGGAIAALEPEHKYEPDEVQVKTVFELEAEYVVIFRERFQ